MKSVQKGFSLIELLIAIAIMVILLGIAAVSFAQAQKSVRDNKRKVDMQTMAQARTLCISNEGDSDCTLGCHPPGYDGMGTCLVSKGYLTPPYPVNDREPEYDWREGPDRFCAQMEDPTAGNSDENGNIGAATTHYCVLLP